MNGIENISEKILADARQKAAEILAEAQKNAEAIRADGQKKADQETASLQSSLQARLASDSEKARMAQDLARRMRLQGEKQALGSEVFDRALDTLLHLPEENTARCCVRLRCAPPATAWAAN